MIITISGMPGSGKTSVGEMLAKKLGFKHYSIGDLRGKMAQERGLTIDELNKLGEKEPWTDKEADEYMRKLGKTEDNLVFDARLGFHFIPHSKKVFLKVDPRVGAERIFKAPRRPDEPQYESVEQVIEENRNRVESDRKRYEKWYRVDCLDKGNYDLVVDTTKLTKEQVLEKILTFVKKQD